MQDAHEHDADRLPEVEQVTDPRVAEYLLRFTQVGPERDDAGAGHERGGVGRHIGPCRFARRKMTGPG